MRDEFRDAHARAVEAMEAMLALWPEQEVENYPEYLPSFDEFLSDFAEVRPNPKAIYPARFSIDALEGMTFEGYTRGETWNGFACPLFEWREANRILQAFRKEGDTGAHYDEERDEFVFYGFPDVDHVPERFPSEVVAGAGRVYAVGAFSWVWFEEK